MRRDPVLVSQRLFDEPRRMQIRFAIERVLKERPNVHLAVHFAIAADIVLVDECFISSWVVQADEVPSESVALDGAIRTPDHGEFRLFSDGARGDVSVHEGDEHIFAGEELALEFVVNPVDCEGHCQ